MKTRTFAPRLLLTASAVAFCALAFLPSRLYASVLQLPPPQYTVTVLGTLGFRTFGLGVNASGQVAGISGVVGHAVRWAVTTPEDLGTIGGDLSVGIGINDAGQVAGYSTITAGPFGSFQAVRWTGTEWEDLGTLGGGGSIGYGINASGQIVGSSYLAYGTTQHAVIWTDTTPTDLGTLSGSSHSEGFGINASGQVAGFAVLSDNSTGHAVRWTGTTPTDLGTLGGSASAGYGINASGQVVGFAQITGNGPFHAVVWTDATPTDLGTLGGSSSRGLAINTFGDVIGISDITGNATQDAFLYTGGTMYDLETLLLPGSGVTDLTVGSPYSGNGINDFGQIAASGTVAGQQRALLLTPTAPVTTTISIGILRIRTGMFAAGVPYQSLAPFTHDSGHGTTARLLGGTAGVNRTVAISFTGESSEGLASDVVDVTGTTFFGTVSDTFVLSLTYDEAAAALLPGGEAAMRLLWLDPALSQWVNAVDGNTGATTPFFAGDGAYDPALDFHLGYYGVDTATNEVWAVINHNSTFSAAPTPEPTSAALLGLGALLLTTRRRRLEP